MSSKGLRPKLHSFRPQNSEQLASFQVQRYHIAQVTVQTPLYILPPRNPTIAIYEISETYLGDTVHEEIYVLILHASYPRY